MTVERIMKRDGSVVAFDRQRIENAMYAAARAVGNGVGRAWAETLSWAAVAILNERVNGSGRVPHVEEIQDIVEEVLVKSGNPKVAKAYILYRQQRAEARATERMLLDSEKLVEDYLQRADWRVNENSNMNYSLQGLNFYLASSIAARYWLHRIYPPEVQHAHIDGDMHLHDLGMLSVYCCGWDLMDLLEQGFGGVSAKIESLPPKHLRTALGQLVNFFYTLQGESAGAVAVSNFDTLLAPFVRYDGLDYTQTKQAVQEFVFNINVPTRVGFQTPFTNVTMDLVCPSTLANEPVLIGGEMQDATYGEFQPEMDMINRAFAEVMLAGDARGRVFTFPIPTYNISTDFDWDNPNLEPIWAMTARYGTPYFCLEKNTPVLLGDYTAAPIKTVRVGDHLIDEHGRPTTVTAVYSRKSDKIVHITLQNGVVISATPTHKFPTNNGLKEAAFLSLNDQLIRSVPATVTFGATNITLNYRELEELFDIFVLDADLKATQVLPQDLTPAQPVIMRSKPFPQTAPRLVFARPESRYDTNSQKINLPESMSPELCRLLGYLVGDGYYAKKDSTVTFVSMNEALLQDYQAILTRLGVNHHLAQAGHSAVAKEVQCHSVELRQFLMELGLQRVIARDKIVPHIIYQCPEEQVVNFIRGLFDTDGSVDGKRRVVFYASSSERLAYQVQGLLLRLGIASHLSKKGGAYKVTITGDNVAIYASKIGFTHTEKAQRLTRHGEVTGRKTLGDVLLSTPAQVQQLITTGHVPPSYRYSDGYQGYYRVPRAALKSVFPGELPIVGDYVVQKSSATTQAETIVGLQTEIGEFDVVDVTVDSPTHLFTLYGGILSHNSNFINSDMSPEDARSMCCRLRLDNRELRKRTGGLFAAAPLTGSVGVVTLNLARQGYLARDEGDFQARVEHLMEIGRTSLEIKRKMLETFTERGLYPYSYYFLRNVKASTGKFWSNHFSTIGLNGMHEACLNLLGVGIEHPDGRAFAIRTLEFMRTVLQRFQEETGHLYNLEATPAEGATYRLARTDKERYPDLRASGSEAAPYYTNSTHLPVDFSDDLFEVLDHQDDLQTLYTGGTVLHIFLGEQLDDWRQARQLVRSVAENYRLPYYTLTPTFSICPVHGYIPGNHPYCPYEHTPEQLKRFGRPARQAD